MNGKGEIQLLPGTKKRLGIRVTGENRFLYIGSAILGAAIVGAFWFNFNIKALETQIKNLDEQLFILEQKRDKKAELSVQTTRQQVLVATQLIDDHVYLTKAFSKMESLVKEDVQVKNIAYDLIGNKISMRAKATSYTVIAHQLASLLSDDSILDVSLGKMTPSSDGIIEFSLDLSYTPSKLLKNKKIE
ncbi:MAG: hypothetical protein HYT62_04465 [Candidatus Yanofskybacteria bacterium]|nr:hypothetical protein [Candidatus Yanofskybacteria bacterium]